ncbi:hypothetical protein E3U55_06850 [Filobacillus milosensis]|uniref:Competence protein CoiA n=1 Tax=Filobacillus milosensis TaxID=94137 RepID=A0A4Y8IL99_9BACI|nr:competence protein CoiA family protein [Filobacillus milosensis]TFB22013.1 hypothetical protein E3U55_06850 [Filobacillus milosensis]
MLKAVDQNGAEIMAHNKTHEQLELLRHQPLYCPECRQKVILKAGQITIPHFAHHQQTDCPNKRSESEEHLKGKLDLYDWAIHQGFPAKIEHSLPSINQRLDVIFKVKNQWIAIEYQCSPINPSVLNSRTIGIASKNIYPIWIFGTTYYKPNRYKIKMNSILRSSVFYSMKSKLNQLFFYDSTKENLVIASDLYSNKSQAFAHICSKRLNHTKFSDWFEFRQLNTSILYNKWILEKKFFRTSQKRHVTHIEQQFLNDLYQRALHPQFLPSCVHLPVKNAHRYKTPIHIWQTYVILYLNHQEIGDIFTFKQVYHSVKKYFDDSFTSIYPSDVTHPILYYLRLLSKLNLIKEVRKSMFVKAKEFYFPNTLDEALQEDRKILQKLLKF